MMKLIILMLSTLWTTTLQGLMLSNPDVQASIDQKTISENQPIQGMISITHEKSDAVDMQSFTMEGKKLEVELDRAVEISPQSSVVVSFFRFSLPGKGAGLYELPEIAVKVGRSVYSSIPSTYEVQKAKIQPKPSTPQPKPSTPQSMPSTPQPMPSTPQPMPSTPQPMPSTPQPMPSTPQPKTSTPQTKESPANSFLKLELDITGTPQLYPKQRFQVIYKFNYNGNIELSEEQLPLLDPSGFVKVGSKINQEYQEQDHSVQQISQTLEAVKPGEYSFGASVIRGRAYKTDFLGNRVFQPPALESSVPPKILKVVPFPAEKKPPSFNEAIGPFNIFKVSLASPTKVHVGDKILLKIEIAGEGQVSTVPLPELCCQPGFSGVFQQSDLPPSEQMIGNSKQFVVEMRPLTALVKEIPSIEFSFFVPETGKYGILKSDPIPIEVIPLAPSGESLNKVEKPSAIPSSGSTGSWRKEAAQLPSIEIVGNEKLSPKDLVALPFGSWWVFLIIPLGIVVMAAEIKIKQILRLQKMKIKAKTSRDYFEEAIAKSASPSEFYEGMILAFLSGLKEKNMISPDINMPDSLTSEGVQGEVRDYLLTLERNLFAEGKKNLSDDNIRKARELFSKLT